MLIVVSCADSFREDLTSRGLEKNIYRVWYFSPREKKHLNVCGCCALSAEPLELTIAGNDSEPMHSFLTSMGGN
jgi:hypothetical protein